ncbi:YslB family protein [Bacillus sp. Marseille-P3661]|uniref:YslB family protein n=1 Tax=Bacillus sp. Marseille-P3661 TaxID=1936234 RepID=UPI00215532BC|nr:YslB family protein [Bacillus sp. Marseille-P3661]
MFNKTKKLAIDEALSKMTIPAYGYELIRETLLKDILGKDYNSILYWGGKNLARKNPLNSTAELIQFFEDSGWGALSIVKESTNEVIFELTSEYIGNRLMRSEECSFQLEAGFLAEQIQFQVKQQAEALEQLKRKQGIVTFIIQWN